MNATVIIYDTNRQKVAYLPKVYQAGVEERLNELSRAWFHLPLDDVHVPELSVLRYAEVFDEDERIDLFRIVKVRTVRVGQETYYRYECEHVLGVLQDDKLDAILYSGPGTAVSLANVLAEQTVANWQLGTCEFSEQYLYEWAAGTSLLAAFLDIPARFKSQYQISCDTASYPWAVSLLSPPTVPSAYLDYGKNLKGITKEEDATELFTRLYAYGAGAGTDQIDITTLAPGGLPYLDAPTLATYGLIVKRWVDQRYTTAQGLYDAAVAYLAAYSIPLVRYTVDAAELFRLTAEPVDRFTLGAVVGVNDADLGIAVEVRVVSISRSSLDEAPGAVTLELANKRGEFVFTGYIEENDLTNIDIHDIPGGFPGQLPGTPSGCGLYICTDYLGYFCGGAWKTYIDIIGRLRAEGTNAYVHWDPTGLGSLDIKGIVTITGGDTYDDIQTALTTAVDALAIADGEIVGWYQPTPPLSGMYFGDIWIDTDGHVPLTTDDIYRYEDPLGGSQGVLAWRAAPTNAIGIVYLNAATAQTTATGAAVVAGTKIKTFFQQEPPTASTAGDLWVDTNDNNKLYRWSGSIWAGVTGAVAVLNVIGTAYIENLAVTDAKIATLSVGKLTSGTLVGQYIKLQSNGAYIAGGKTGYSDTNPGFFLGWQGLNALMNIGDATYYLKWTGTDVLVAGAINCTVSALRSYIRDTDLYITGSIIMNRPAPNGDGLYHSIYGCDELRYTSTRFLYLDDGFWQYDAANYINLHNVIGADANIIIYAQAGQLQLRVKDAASALYIEDWLGTGGAGSGWIKVSVGATVRYIRLWTTA